ncbi:MAG: UbiH/UbiF/VisC/COQ6 family ubiquinone biosynthesis hydroxylase [Gammaproteobacteria bacterium]|nr:UbiH/UbiF/VisC/COQ6 family ubiquinone biosynthesis hydroxylase [Gammaproteobacteria bacterium]MDE0410593.1 UbiH/UbiF/VisC/COQ6 family ubiquinone biosynthesis hydroxylase [Gammaproteobacteria bacterium]
MTAQVIDVIIVGAGMSGLTLANLLARQGRSLAIVDRCLPAEFDPSGPSHARVTAVSPGSKTIFEYTGVWSGIKEKRVLEFKKMVVWDEASTASIKFFAEDMSQPCLGYIVENSIIQSTLYEALEKISGIQWCVPSSVENVFCHDHEIEVTLTDDQVLRAKLLVGADGSRSAIRNLAGISYTETPYHQLGIVAKVHTELPHECTAWQRFLKTGPLALLPAGGEGAHHECSIVWSADSEYASQLMRMDDRNFEQEVTCASGRQLGKVTLKSKRASFSLASGQAQALVKPRVALIGDAAHTIHPLAGQGANLGLTDVAVLADTLAGSKRDLGSYRLLRVYERARKGEVHVMQHAMSAFAAVFSTSSLPAIVARSTALSLADHSLPLKRFFMKQAMGLSSDRPVFAR